MHREYNRIARWRSGSICADGTKRLAASASWPRDHQARGDRDLRSVTHVATPLSACEQRDRKGPYAKARVGLIAATLKPGAAFHDLGADLRIQEIDKSLDWYREKVMARAEAR